MAYEKVDEGNHAAEFLLSEANGYRSREEVTIGAGELEAGTVLGQVTASEEYVQLDQGAADGSETAAAILYHYVDATSATQQATVIVQEAEVDDARLIWPDGADEAAGAADLAENQIKVR